MDIACRQYTANRRKVARIRDTEDFGRARAPTGTISMSCDNISSGIEPVFRHFTRRDIDMPSGKVTVDLPDYAVETWGLYGKTADKVTPLEHIKVQAIAQKHVDSAVSKTCNVPKDIPWEDYKDLYMFAWDFGVKGCTVYRSGCKREGLLTDATPLAQDQACFIDPNTGVKTCAD